MKIQVIGFIALTALAVSGIAQAEQGRAMGKRQNFTRDMTHTTGSGKTFGRHTEQVATDNGFTRTTDATSPAGKTATRTVTGTRDPDSQTYTRTVTGTRFNGETYSREQVTTRTGNE